MKRSALLIATVILIVLMIGQADAAGWSIDDGTLTISNMSESDATTGLDAWHAHALSASPGELAGIRRVVIVPDGARKIQIPYGAFKDCVSLESLVSPLPITISSIGYDAFKDCKSLKRISFVSSQNLFTISEGAFESSGLEEIRISKDDGSPVKLDIYGERYGRGGAFSDSAIKSVVVDGSISKIGDGAFKGTNGAKIFMRSHEAPSTGGSSISHSHDAFVGAIGAEIHAYDDADSSQRSKIIGSYTPGSVTITFDIHTPDTSSAWDSDDTSHWKPCTVHPSERASLEPHSPSDLHTDAARHWMICAICAAEHNSSAHDAPAFDKDIDEHWKTCTTCGDVFSRAAHSLGEWQHGAEAHWRECECGYAGDVGAHAGDGACDVCGWIMGGHASEYSATHIGSPSVGAEDDLAVAISSGAARLLTILIDGVEVGPDEYGVELADGGVVITVSRVSIGRLDEGDHVLRAIFADGSASVSFSVVATASGADRDRIAVSACSASSPVSILAILLLCSLSNYRKTRDPRRS